MPKDKPKDKGKPKSKNMAINELKGFILILVALWLVWFFMGGPSKSKDEKPFINPPTQTQTGNSQPTN